MKLTVRFLFPYHKIKHKNSYQLPPPPTPTFRVAGFCIYSLLGAYRLCILIKFGSKRQNFHFLTASIGYFWGNFLKKCCLKSDPLQFASNRICRRIIIVSQRPENYIKVSSLRFFLWVGTIVGQDVWVLANLGQGGLWLISVTKEVKKRTQVTSQ